MILVETLNYVVPNQSFRKRSGLMTIKPSTCIANNVSPDIDKIPEDRTRRIYRVYHQISPRIFPVYKNEQWYHQTKWRRNGLQRWIWDTTEMVKMIMMSSGIATIYYPYSYNWERRDDPTSKSYYNKDVGQHAIFLQAISGLTAKRGSQQRQCFSLWEAAF